jgi:hypothetical protein
LSFGACARLAAETWEITVKAVADEETRRDPGWE